MANLTKALRKNLSHGFIIFLWFFTLYDFVAHFSTRLSVDPKSTKALFVLIPVGLLFNIIWMVLLAFWNNTEWMRKWKKENKIATDIFPCFLIPYTATIFGFLYFDNSYTSYKFATYSISGLICVYVHMCLSSNWLVPKSWSERFQNSFRKYLQIGFIVLLWAWLYYDFLAHFGTRMSVNPSLTKTLLVLIPVGLVFNVIWTVLLVLWHKNIACMEDDCQIKATNIFQLFFIPYTIAIFVCLYYDNSYTSYKNACFMISGLISVYVHTFLTSGWLVPDILNAPATMQASGYKSGQMRDMNRDQERIVEPQQFQPKFHNQNRFQNSFE